MSDANEILKFHQDVESLFKGPDPEVSFKETLRSQLLQRSTRPVKMQRQIFRPVWAVLVALMVFLLAGTLIIGPQKVLAAVQGWLGYVPGVGFVAEGAPLRVLAEPVSQERESVTVTVEQVLADSQQTTLLFRVNGLSVEKANVPGEDVATGSIPELILPDGTHLPQKDGSGNGWGTGYESRLYFDPIPQDVEQVTLLIPVLQGYPQGAGPENWQIPLKLVKADGEVTLMPVQVIEPSATPEAAIQVEPEVLRLSLVRTVELEDGYLLQGVYSWDPAKYASLSITPVDFEVKDANGTILPLDIPFDVQDVEYNMANEQPWAIKVMQKDAPGPWTISVLHAYSDMRYELPFNLDFGNSPISGQAWQIGQSFDLGGQTLHVISATLVTQSDGSQKVTFQLQGSEDVLSADVYDPGHASDLAGSGNGAGPGGEGGNLTSTMIYSSLPTGVHQFIVSHAYLRLNGEWSLTWQPTGTGVGQVTTVQPAQQVCLNDDVWKTLVEKPGQVPAGLSGKLLVYGKLDGEAEAAVFTMNLDGSDRQKVTIWPLASLSPDGKTLAYSDDKGLVIQDMQSGESKHISGTGPTDWRPIWSPDGQWIAYNHGQGDVQIAVVSADGSQNHVLSADTSNRNGISWWPDSSRIVYTDFIDTGAMIFNTIDLNGQINSLFIAGEGMKYSNPVISPDASQIAYEARVSGGINYGIYLSSLDGMSKTLLAGLDAYTFNSAMWSKDGKWVLVNVTDSINEYSVLINPQTCQVIKLMGVNGKVLSWSEQ